MDALKYGLPLDTYFTEWNYEAAEVFLLAGEADVVCGDKHLAQNVHLVKGSPEGAVGVAIQLLIFGQPEKGTVSFTLRPGIQVTANR